MFNSILNAAKVALDSLILNIFIILGVVIAGAVIVYLLWEAVNALVQKSKNSNGNASSFTSKDKHKSSENSVISDFILDEEKVEEQAKEEVVAVSEEKAAEEKVAHEAELSEEERENAERRAYLEARRQELIRRMQAEMEDDSEEENKEESQEETTEEVVEEVAQAEEVEQPVAVALENVSLDEESEEVVEAEPAEEVVVEAETEEIEEGQPIAEEVVEEVAEEPQVDTLAEERRELELERERYALMVKELEEAKRALAEQLDREPVTVVETVVETNNLTLEELEQRLADAEERLKATEKEFKQCKKEYIPLRRVWTAHEKDEKKLRRKEALVAKQKVLLYGVNNYADIDEEKAQKLAEDLDLLDGLKLSVQHCEEVMKKNEERYPLLEKMYNVLKLRNDELKKDIAKYKAEIAKLQEEQTDAE